MRQTNLTLKQLVKELKELFPVIPHCAIINEIGEICKTVDVEYAEAEKFLAELLIDENPEYKHLAYCWLYEIGDVQNETSRKLEEFGKDSSNKEIIEKAEKAVAELIREEFKTLSAESKWGSQEAEATLCGWLNKKKPAQARFSAYLWLAFSGIKLSGETALKLKQFETNPNNKDVIDKVGRTFEEALSHLEGMRK